MKTKYKKIIPLLLIALLSAIVLFLTSCSDKSLKGKLVNHHGDIGRTNSYEQYGEFVNDNYYDDTIKDSIDAGAIVPALALSDQEMVYATTRGTLMLITTNEINWEKKLGADQAVNATMCADKEQNIYAVSNTGIIYSYSIEGNLRWKKTIVDSLSATAIPCDLLALDDGILSGTSDGVLSKYAFDGKLIWSKKFQTGINKTLTAHGNNAIILISSQDDNDTLAMLNSDGSVKWKTPAGIRLVKYPLASETTIYCTGIKYIGEDILSQVLAYDLNGKLKWTKELSFVPRYISVSMSDELFANVFQPGIGEQISAIIKLDKNGKLVWKKFFNFTIPTPIMISPKSLAFLGVTHNTVGLYYVDREKGVITNIQSFSNEAPIIHSPTVRPDGAISFAYYQKIGFLRVDEPWINKILPW